jgi:flagellar hook-associated protein 2
MGSSIDGLVSGLDTTSIINQLVSLERAPATRLAGRQQDAKNVASAYAGLRSQVDTIRTAAQALDTATDWQPVKATVSDSASATVTTGTGATPGSLSFTVKRLAAAHSVVSTSAALAATDEWATGDITLNVNGVDKTITVPPTDATGVRDLAAVTKAINGAGLGLTAQAMQTSTGAYQLQISATTTGAASQFSVVGGLVSTFATASQGQDASIELANGLVTATSPTNTFDDLLPGVDITVKATTTQPVTVSITPDTDALANKVQALVSAVNASITSVKTLSAYDAVNNKASVLTGDPTARRLSSEATRALIDPVGTGTTSLPSLAGITLGKDGTVSFDKAKFLDAYGKDPAGVQAMFVTSGDPTKPSLADRLVSFADVATQTGKGYLRTAEQSQLDQATEYGKQIDTVNARADAQAAALKQQFAALETALASMKDQSNWLASQVAGLPTVSSSKN